MRMIKTDYSKDGRVYLQGYLQEKDIVYRGKRNRPAILICPGGAYQYCAVREMDPVALAYAAKGYHTFILHYSVQEYARGFQPLKEVSWAIETIRKHAEEWNVIEDQIVAAGFSAGGHLALAAGLKADFKPAALILGYPVVDMFLLDQENIAEDPLVRALVGKEQISQENLESINLLSCVTKKSPPLFVFNTFEDEQVEKTHSMELIMRYGEVNVPCEYHLFQKGRHGLSMADETTENGEKTQNVPHVAAWFQLSTQWLESILKENEE